MLRLPPLPYAKVRETAEAGAVAVAVDRTDTSRPGMKLHFVAPGKVHPFTGKPVPFVLATVERIEPGVLALRAPLEFPIPAGTVVYREGAPNAFAISGVCENITIERLTIDGGRRQGDPGDFRPRDRLRRVGGGTLQLRGRTSRASGAPVDGEGLRDPRTAMAAAWRCIR